MPAAWRLEVYGSVQGVGFRPYVVRLANGLGLDGWVQNAGGHVVIETIGTRDAVADLARRLPVEAPPHAVVRSVTLAAVDGCPTPEHVPGFRVVDSTADADARQVPPDLATCDDCVAELFDPGDRRYRYPFINCTNCGPRATVIDELPYDRCRTTMAPFVLCDECAAEYSDVADRRFHAEPVACPTCGPQLSWLAVAPHAGATRPIARAEVALAQAEAVIASGGIVAIKGLGGYQLVCDARNPVPVARLRERKGRPDKPFAVMVNDVDAARRFAIVTHADGLLLRSAARPIVLVVARPGSELAGEIHPGTDQVGVFLPSTPLHHVLLHDLGLPLVVTSGNRSDEPIAIDDSDAIARLSDIADGFVTHDREIRARYDDSVTRTAGGRPAIVRRARGYAPEPLPLPHRLSEPLLAVGAQLKHTFTLAEGTRAIVSPHIGDLADYDTFAAFEQTLAHLSRLVAIDPVAIAHDLHPAYLSTQYARRRPSGHRVAVQHHHAHIASCAAEHGITEPVIGVAYDGLGWGDDGTLWGGEILIADLAGYRRVGRFGTAPLPGGEAAIRRPARMALGYLIGSEHLGGDAIDADLTRWFSGRLPDREVDIVARMITRGVNSPRASSAGRLFDAVASILGLCDHASYEGQAAVALEAAAGGTCAAELPWRLTRASRHQSDELWVYDPAPTLAAVLAAASGGEPVARLAGAFHATIVAVSVAMCVKAAAASGLRTVCLSGGVFQNRLLTSTLTAALRDEGLFVHTNERVPTNDGGISYGQAAVAAARLRGE